MPDHDNQLRNLIAQAHALNDADIALLRQVATIVEGFIAARANNTAELQRRLAALGGMPPAPVMTANGPQHVTMQRVN